MKVTKGTNITRAQKPHTAQRTGEYDPIVWEKIRSLQRDLDSLQRCVPTFTPTELRALNWFAAKYGRGDLPPMHLARWILQHVLAHPDLICGAIASFLHYRDTEGFRGRADELADARIAQRPEYC